METLESRVGHHAAFEYEEKKEPVYPPKNEGWKSFSESGCPDLPHEIEMWYGYDTPNKLFKAGETVISHPVLMTCVSITHWREVKR